jgi:acetoin utilization deacetylase AcuC-like enzyme
LLTFFNEHHAQHDERAGHAIAALAGECGRRGLGRIVTPHGVPLTSLERIHTPRYLHFLRTAWNAAGQHGTTPQPTLLPTVWPRPGERRDIEPDDVRARIGLYAADAGTPLTAGTWTAAKTGADCAINAAHALRLGERSTFALTSPAGHHAGAESFGGGCFLNNAALAAQHLLDDGLARVAVLDIDPHHGNGTQAIFYERRDVLALSIHADPRGAYPWYGGYADETGAGDGQGCTMNLPLPPDAGAAQWLMALETACVKLAGYGPQALVVAFGAGGDPRARWQLAGADYLRIGERIGYLGLPTAFVLETVLGTVPESGAQAVNLMNVLEGFETAA